MWGAFESRSLYSLSEKEERRRRENREGRRSQGRSPLCVTVFTFSKVTSRCWCPLWRFLRLRNLITLTQMGGEVGMGPVTRRDFFSIL